MLPTKEIIKIIAVCFLVWLAAYGLLLALGLSGAQYVAGVPAAVVLSHMRTTAQGKQRRR